MTRKKSTLGELVLRLDEIETRYDQDNPDPRVVNELTSVAAALTKLQHERDSKGSANQIQNVEAQRKRVRTLLGLSF